MKQEDKQLLLKDLCSRLPYGVKVNFSNTECILSNIGNDSSISLLKSDKRAIYATNIQYIKPYLRPMSSMSEEEKKEHFGRTMTIDIVQTSKEVIDWLLAHHFDFRGLIEKGLAIKVTEDNNPYKET